MSLAEDRAESAEDVGLRYATDAQPGLRRARALPRIRRRVTRDLSRRGLPRERVLAAVVRLLETTLLRVGNGEYAHANKSFGLTTLRNRHAKVGSTKIQLRFPGKAGRVSEV